MEDILIRLNVIDREGKKMPLILKKAQLYEML